MPQDYEKISLYGSYIELSEDKSDPDILNAKFIISGFGTNKNNVKINRDHIDEWVDTLVDKPVVGKVSVHNGVSDFESHNMRIISRKDKNGKMVREAEFDTTPFGHFVEVSVEEVNGIEYITATAKLYKRYKNAIDVIKRRMKNGTIKTSWEIAVEKSDRAIENGVIVKVINKARFLAHCLLSENVEAAYDESQLLEVASKQDDELNTALIADCMAQESDTSNIGSDIQNFEDKEVNTDMNDIEENVSTELSDEHKDEITEQVAEQENEDNNVSTTVEESKCGDDKKKEKSECKDDDDEEEKEKSDATENVDNNAETSALTVRDLRNKLESAYCEPAPHTYGWCYLIFPADNIAWFTGANCPTELDYIEVKYVVENDNVTITERNPVRLIASPREINQVVAQKNNAIVEMSEQIKTLNDEVATLKPFKERVDEIEKAEREAQFEKDKNELSQYAIASGYITQEEIETSEEIKGFINGLDKGSIKSLIADRVVASLTEGKNETKVETSATDTNTKPEVQLNLNATDTNAVTDYQKVISRYIGR